MSSLFLWLLLLVNTVFAAVTFYPKTNVVEICAGGNHTLTCVTDTGTLVWYRVGGLTKTYYTSVGDPIPTQLGDHITVYLTNVNDSVITSVANITRAPLALNGTVIQCSDSGNDHGAFDKEKTLLVSADKILAPRYLRFTALNFTSASFEWVVPSFCGHLIDVYNIQILHNISLKNITSLTTSVNVISLSQGVEYNITVFGRNLNCSDIGEKANLLMTLDVPEQVVNLTIIFFLENSILASWQQPPSSSRPPVMYYTVQHNVTTDVDGGISLVKTTMTNITIDGAQPGHVYYIEVTAVNILGPGPPRTTSHVIPSNTPLDNKDILQMYSVYIIAGVVCFTLMLFGLCLVFVAMIRLASPPGHTLQLVAW